MCVISQAKEESQKTGRWPTGIKNNSSPGQSMTPFDFFQAKRTQEIKCCNNWDAFGRPCVHQSVCSQEYVPWRKSQSPELPLGPCPRPLRHLVMKLPPRKFPVNTVWHSLSLPLSLSLLFSETQSELVCCNRRGAGGTGMGLEFLQPRGPPRTPRACF